MLFDKVCIIFVIGIIHQTFSIQYPEAFRNLTDDGKVYNGVKVSIPYRFFVFYTSRQWHISKIHWTFLSARYWNLTNGWQLRKMRHKSKHLSTSKANWPNRMYRIVQIGENLRTFWRKRRRVLHMRMQENWLGTNMHTLTKQRLEMCKKLIGLIKSRQTNIIELKLK